MATDFREVSWTVDRQFLKTVGRSLYSRPPAEIAARELLQNAWDACLKSPRPPEISIEVLFDGKDTLITCADNGVGMDDHDIINLFLKLGGSGKRDTNGSTGGFGVAKAVLCSSEQWSCHTRNWMVSEGDNEPLNLRETSARVGTRIQVQIHENNPRYDYQIKNVMAMLYFCELKAHMVIQDVQLGKTYYDGEIGSNILSRFKVIKDPTNSKMWTSSVINIVEADPMPFRGLTIYRINGLVQYTGQRSYGLVNIIIDIDPGSTKPGDEDYPMSLSRERLRGEIDEEIRDYISGKSVDSISSDRQVTYTPPETHKTELRPGYLLKGQRRREVVAALSEAAGDDFASSLIIETLKIDDQQRMTIKDVQSKTYTFSDLRVQWGNTPFITEYDIRETETIRVSEETFKKLWAMVEARAFAEEKIYDKPAIYYYRYEKSANFKMHAKIFTMWQEVLKFVMPIGKEFGIGLTSDEGTFAEFHHEGGVMYFIVNPDEIMAAKTHEGMYLKLWHSACHEVAHIVVDIHDQRFSAEESRLMKETADSAYENMRSIIEGVFHGM